MGKSKVELSVWRQSVLGQLQELDMRIADLSGPTMSSKGHLYNVFRGSADPSERLMMLINTVLEQRRNEQKNVAKTFVERRSDD